MTGIERLRQMAEDFKNVKTAEHCTFIVNTWRGRYIDDAIADIADQIERERNVSDREEHDAAVWVREHGGLDHVKAEWRSRVPHDLYERRRQRLLGHIAECETALGRRRRSIEELGRRVGDLTRENAELRKRAMPEGCDEEFIKLHMSNLWGFMFDVMDRLGVDKSDSDAPEIVFDALDRRLMPEGTEWPRYESGEMVQIGDDVVERFIDDPIKVRSIEFRDGYTFLREVYKTDRTILVHPGERVKRPAPKVLDADGVEIRVGDTVYSTRDTESGTVVYAYPPGDDGQPSVKVGAFWHHASELTHRAPVLAADGRPLREGETVWKRTNGEKLTVMRLVTSVVGLVGCSDGTEAFGTPVIFNYCPSDLTHEPPDSWERWVEDADKSSCEYFGQFDTGCVGTSCDGCRRDPYTCDSDRDKDLVRRARALAERESGE